MIHLKYFFLGIWELRWKILLAAIIAGIFSALYLWPRITTDVFASLLGLVTLVLIVYNVYELGWSAAMNVKRPKGRKRI